MRGAASITALATTTSIPGMVIMKGAEVMVMLLLLHHLDDTVGSPKNPRDPHKQGGSYGSHAYHGCCDGMTTPTHKVMGEGINRQQGCRDYKCSSSAYPARDQCAPPHRDSCLGHPHSYANSVQQCESYTSEDDVVSNNDHAFDGSGFAYCVQNSSPTHRP